MKITMNMEIPILYTEDSKGMINLHIAKGSRLLLVGA